ncbi:hypothetical protein RhiirA4_466974 [Rhizophagus irregularis]|uniref:Uncharacterized protein n=1 Tax=Rhizophagus irregularis TaxID=588596 RepID=A0A2I1GV10_9GLOM|nr:hypothetical protein RhiirA4_466974 [Rhizophagus irregularis]
MGGFGPIPASFFGFGISYSSTTISRPKSLILYGETRCGNPPELFKRPSNMVVLSNDKWSKYEVYDIIAICVPLALISGSFWNWL